MNDTTPRRSAPRVIAIATAALGAAVVVGTLTTSAVATAAVASVSTETRTLDVAGVRELDVDADTTALRVLFSDVEEATLTVTSGTGVDSWTFERDANELTVAAPDRQWGSIWPLGGELSAILTLPRSLQGDALDASLSLDAGELSIDGRFGELEVEMGAGGLNIDGSAQSVSVQLDFGNADIRLADTRSAQFEVSAGALSAVLTGTAPDVVGIDVSAGSAEVTLPDGTYDVRSDASAGEIENGLSTAAGAASVVNVAVSAGSVILTPPR